MLAKISAGIAESEERSKEVVEEVIPEGMIIVNNNSSFNSLDLTRDRVYVRNNRGYMGSQYCGNWLDNFLSFFDILMIQRVAEHS